jgi:hypothetical protein
MPVEFAERVEITQPQPGDEFDFVRQAQCAPLRCSRCGPRIGGTSPRGSRRNPGSHRFRGILHILTV